MYILVDTLGSPVPGKYRTYLDAYKRLCTEPKYNNYTIKEIDYDDLEDKLLKNRQKIWSKHL